MAPVILVASAFSALALLAAQVAQSKAAAAAKQAKKARREAEEGDEAQRDAERAARKAKDAADALRAQLAEKDRELADALAKVRDDEGGGGELPEHKIPPPADDEDKPAPAPSPTPGPSPMGARDAAQRLFDYVTAEIRAGRAANLGDKRTPNATVRAMQTLMRGIVADGIYGPKTRARGKELLGREFPAREGAKKAPAPPAPPKDKPTPAPAKPSEKEPATKRTITLRPGFNYAAEIKLGEVEAAATNAQVLAALQKQTGPFEPGSVSGSGRSRKAVGTYRGAQRTIDLPPEIVSFKEVGQEVKRADPAPAPAPKPTPTPAPAPAQRSALQAARDLYAHASKLIAEGKGSQLGTKNAPSAFVKSAQSDMGMSPADGIYGPATRAKGQQLTGRPFPAR